MTAGIALAANFARGALLPRDWLGLRIPAGYASPVFKGIDMKKLFIALAVAGLSVSTVAQADLRIDARQLNQQRLIDAGKRSGKLSLAERDRLTAQQHAIDRTKKQLERSGGRFTKAEVARVNAMLDKSENDITRAKQNRTRGPHGIHM